MAWNAQRSDPAALGPDASMPDAVFVFGAAHSGTTILYRLLAYHPAFAWPSQYSLRRGELPGRRRLPLSGLLDSQLRRVTTHHWKKEIGRLSALVPVPAETHTVWRHLLTPPVEPDAVGAVLDLLRHRLGRPTALVKFPAFSAHLPALASAVPRARFLHIVRDGRAVALSDESKFARHGSDALERSARYWTTSLDAVDEARAMLELVEIRYEDLVGDTVGTLRDIVDRLGLPPHRPLDARAPTLSSTNATWFDRTDPTVLTGLTERLEPWLERYGYLDGDGSGGR